MIPFSDTFKLYLRDNDKHKLSIRVTDWVCDTWLIDDWALRTLCSCWFRNSKGTVIAVDGNDWFVQHKKQGTPQEYVRISIWHAGACRDYRASAQDLHKLSAQVQPNQPISTDT